ncbi:xanthine dehydrogenase family protein molybdopterin-binding subunit [Candidatus Nephthysia bennettiae]|uniref:Xanthine dehydrogenase family protein molybdopterin-binding subunit n=1 Tax=Candidatus Nephthysia bennettiae TaxID=3127016 RepID=A0A934JYW3_9BACT|nr:xanthine dehydrogenase family protein molybdopterin-binding subunit [Candidatus Dormibacteraeota bacterium]MBJ7611934.1 xanthine dehydrogenase family protein molybdopterin-binding subunit [Candidatus Dormibacteraeota bacterium]
MPGSILGTRVIRVEDPDLLMGRGSFVDDVHVEGLTSLAFVRSPIPHGRISGIDVSAARAHPGVVAVLTAADLDIAPYHYFMVLNERCARPPLADGKVRFAGEPVAAVIAETKAAAADAAQLVEVDYDPLPAVAGAEEALAPGAPLQFEELGTNLAAGSREDDDADPLAGAALVVRARLENQRVAVVPMEGNAILAIPAAGTAEHDLTVYVSTQMPHGFAEASARILGMDRARLRVIAPHVGGGFGGKAGVTPEHAVAMAAARSLGRPVSWIETRYENLLTMHGRSQVQYVEMGLDRDGAITGLRCRVIGDAGAYAGFGGGLAIGPTYHMAQGTYRVPWLAYDVAIALTNTAPVGAFRGAGRPEAAAMLERVLDIAADELDIDPVEIRRRNFLQPSEFPLTTLTGAPYDSGDYERSLDKAVALAGYDQLRAEQAARRERGERQLLGIGVASYVEVTGGAGEEYGQVEVAADGTASIRVGTSAHGQGHATAFGMLVADRLGIPMSSITFIQSDTAMVPRGSGTGGSRSLQLGGNAVRAAAEEVLDQGRALAASLLEASPADIAVMGDGLIGVAGVPARALRWSELAQAAEGNGSRLSAAVDFHSPGATYPFGTHVAVVEVDLDTGLVRPLRHVAVDDCGRILNPLLVTGQQHGGIAQGMAQALWEEVIYGSDGTPLTASLVDYGMPCAAELPPIEAANTETPTPLNPLGAKGIGESGTLGSMPAVQNAVVDALSHLGVRHIDMPCTPDRVWQALESAAAGQTPNLWREPPAIFAELPRRGSTASPEAAGADI